MLPLSASSLPANVPELVEAIRRGLQDQGLSPRQVEAQGDSLTSIRTLAVDVSETKLDRAFRPPQLAEAGPEPVEVADFNFTGAPVYFEKTPLEIRLSAKEVKGGMKLTEGRGALVVKSAAAGDISIKAERSALEALLLSFASELAAKQGFEVKKTSLGFTQEGPRAAGFRAEVTAKVFVMSASLALTGRVAIDDNLTAKISNLALDGDGMILKLAGSYAQPYLAKLEGKEYSLLSFAPGGLKLRDVEITAGESLVVRAKFGA